MSVNEEIREQRKKLQGQGLKAYLEYYWDYYKIHTIVAIVVIIFLAVLIRDITNNKPAALDAIFINSEGMDSQTYIQEGFAQYAEINTDEAAIVVDTSANFMSSTIDQTAVATSEKMLALISAGSLDIVVADPNTFGHYAGQETFRDLRDVFSEKELSDMQDDLFYIDQAYIDYLASNEYTDYLMSGKFDENNIYAKMAAEFNDTLEFKPMPLSEMKEPVPVGVILKDSAVIRESGAYTSSVPVAGIVVNTQRIDNAIKFIEYLR